MGLFVVIDIVKELAQLAGGTYELDLLGDNWVVFTKDMWRRKLLEVYGTAYKSDTEVQRNIRVTVKFKDETLLNKPEIKIYLNELRANLEKTGGMLIVTILEMKYYSIERFNWYMLFIISLIDLIF